MPITSGKLHLQSTFPPKYSKINLDLRDSLLDIVTLPPSLIYTQEICYSAMLRRASSLAVVFLLSTKFGKCVSTTFSDTHLSSTEMKNHHRYSISSSPIRSCYSQLLSLLRQERAYLFALSQVIEAYWAY